MVSLLGRGGGQQKTRRAGGLGWIGRGRGESVGSRALKGFEHQIPRGALVTGTSFSAATLSGLAAASKQSQHNKDPAAFALRLAATAADLGPPGRDDIFGASRGETRALMGNYAQASNVQIKHAKCAS